MIVLVSVTAGKIDSGRLNQAALCLANWMKGRGVHDVQIAATTDVPGTTLSGFSDAFNGVQIAVSVQIETMRKRFTRSELKADNPPKDALIVLCSPGDIMYYMGHIGFNGSSLWWTGAFVMLNDGNGEWHKSPLERII